MNWIAASVILLGALVWYVQTTVKAADRRARKTRAASAEPKSIPAAEPQPAPADEPAAKAEEELGQKPTAEKTVDEILSSAEPEAMQEALSRRKDPWQRHRLFTALVEHAYRHRKQTADRVTLLTYSRQYIDEFDRITPVLRRKDGRTAKEAPVFKMMAITLEENQDYDEAIDICSKALRWELDDGTKTGFQGRIERLRRKQS